MIFVTNLSPNLFKRPGMGHFYFPYWEVTTAKPAWRRALRGAGGRGCAVGVG